MPPPKRLRLFRWLRLGILLVIPQPMEHRFPQRLRCCRVRFVERGTHFFRHPLRLLDEPAAVAAGLSELPLDGGPLSLVNLSQPVGGQVEVVAVWSAVMVCVTRHKSPSKPFVMTGRSPTGRWEPLAIRIFPSAIFLSAIFLSYPLRAS